MVSLDKLLLCSNLFNRLHLNMSVNQLHAVYCNSSFTKYSLTF